MLFQESLIIAGLTISSLVSISFLMKERKDANLLGFVFFIILSLRFGLKLLDIHEIIFYELPYTSVNYALGLSTPVCFYFFIKHVLSSNEKFKIQNLLHFVLPIVLSLYLALAHSFFSTQTLSFLNFFDVQDIRFIGILLSSYYFVLVIRAVWKSKIYLLKKKHLQNLKIYVGVFLLGYALLIIVGTFNTMSSFLSTNFTYTIIAICMFFGSLLLMTSNKSMVLSEPLIKKLGFTGENIKSYIVKLDEVMNTEKIYLDPNLRLNEMAKKIDISLNQLSALLNDHKNMSFNQYINSYRVEYAKKLLHDDSYDQVTLEGIAYDSGFNSKTTFYKVFKDFVNMTPGEYKDLRN